MIHTLAWMYAMFISVMLMIQAWRDTTNPKDTVLIMRVFLTGFALAVALLI